MARGINKVILVGNLGKDPEIRYTGENTAVCTVSLATSYKYRDRKTQEEVEKTDWHRLVFFSRLAEIASEYLSKGSQVYVEGRLQTREWEDQESGAKRYMTEVVVNDMVMLGGRGDSRSGGRSSPPSAERRQSGGERGGGERGGGGDEFDDDIPF